VERRVPDNTEPSRSRQRGSGQQPQAILSNRSTGAVPRSGNYGSKDERRKSA
jgi:hypothetical protein